VDALKYKHFLEILNSCKKRRHSVRFNNCTSAYEVLELLTIFWRSRKMKRQLILVLLVTIFVMARPTVGNLMISMRGDDDGFGIGSPVSPGDMVYDQEPAGIDGFDGWVFGTEAVPDFQWTHSYIPFLQITSASLYIQYIDFPESGDGELFIDGIMTNLSLPLLSPWEYGPWTVLGTDFDLVNYHALLMDGSVTFGLNARYDDACSIDYALLTIEGTVIPTPSAAVLGSLGVGLVGWLRRRRML